MVRGTVQYRVSTFRLRTSYSNRIICSSARLLLRCVHTSVFGFVCGPREVSSIPPLP